MNTPREEGYDSAWWALIYDQWNEMGDRAQRKDRELHFYQERLKECAGPVLEAACGTGSILLPLLSEGIDIHGLDNSTAMLARLENKARAVGVSDVGRRIARQSMADFRYDGAFSAVIIPASSFMMLATQEDQVACLKSIREHLQPRGRLLLNFYIPSLADDLLRHVVYPPREEEFGTFEHPETGRPIEVSYSKVCNLATQTETYTWFFEYDSHTAEVPMKARWIYKEEFQLLLRLAGFREWVLYGGWDCREYEGGPDTTDAFWVATAS
jgi:ubiquinone/menaquinone biosynthesis C-methylase UbiE